MAWNIHALNLPSVRSYTEAKQVYAKAKPNNAGNDWRSLGQKRDTSKIVKQDTNGDVRFRYHHTDVVTYKADGTLEVYTFDSSNTVAFAGRFLPNSIQARSHDGRMWVGDLNGMYLPAVNKNLHFILGPHNIWTVDPTTVCEITQLTLDHKKAAKIRKIIAPYLDWLEAAKRVGMKITWDRWNMNVPVFLKEHLANGLIPEELYPKLACMQLRMHDMYVLGGAVSKEPAPFGSLTKRSPYTYSQAWGSV